MKFLIINGPNLNLLGIREKEHYGTESYDTLIKKIDVYLKKNNAAGVYFQSNSEGALIDKIQEAKGNFDGIIINPGAFTHTSIALLDALMIAGIPTVEVHISKVEEREDFRQISYIRNYACKTITGHGTDGYIEAAEHLISICGKDKK